MTVAVFVISLPGRTQRRAGIAAQLESLGVEFEFVDAVDGRNLPEEFLAARQAQRGIIEGGSFATLASEIGCALSHVKCAQLILDRGLAGAVVLEDDAQLLAPFANFVSHFDPADSALDKGSVIVLGGLEDERPGELDRKRWLVPSLFGRLRLPDSLVIAKSVRSERFFLRACAYFMDHTVADRLAQFNAQARTVADNWLLFSQQGVIESIYFPKPWLVRHPTEAELPSLLEPERAELRRRSGHGGQRTGWSLYRRKLRNFIVPVFRQIYRFSR